ncbi:porin [candidate division KSB1 bacterium]
MKTVRMVFSYAVIAVIFSIFLSSDVRAQEGKVLYEKKCGRCHGLYEPTDYPSDDWPGIVRSMKAQSALTNQDIEIISEYLVSESENSKESLSGSHPVLGGYLYTEYFQSPEKTKNYDIHYAAFSVSGWSNDNIQYFAEFELEHGGTGGSNTFVEQAYIDYWMNQYVAVRIGAILTPFNRFDEFHAPLTNFTITRPQVSREIGVSAWKDVGIDFHGFFNVNETSSLSFNLYSINGLGDGSNLRGSRQYRDNNEDKAFGGRISMMQGDLIEFGGSFYNGAWDDNGDYDLNMIGSHVMVRTPFADLYGEYSKADSKNPAPMEDGDMSGYFFQASRLFNSKYRTTIRYGALDYLDTGNLLGRSVSKGNMELSELVFCFGYYPTSKVVFKLEYTLFNEGNRVTDKDNDQFGFQAAVRF